MEYRLLALACIFPCAYILIVLVSLHLNAEVTAAGLVPVEGVTGHQLTYLEEVSHTEGFLQLLVELLVGTGYIYVLHVLGTELVNLLYSLLKTFLVTGHADFLPHDVTELLVVVVHRLSTLVVEEVADTLLDCFLCLIELRSVGIDLWLLNLVRKVVSDGIRKDKISVCKTLHEGGCTETVAAVVGEVGRL